MSFRVFPLLLVGALAFCWTAGGCREPTLRVQTDLAEKIALRLDEDLHALRKEAEDLAALVHSLYERKEELLASARTQDYAFAPNGIFYKTARDEGAALWISGATPITEDVKEIAYITEPLDEVFKALHKRHPLMVQSYYNDRNSLNRIYPSFDTIADFSRGLDIPSFNFYFLADAKHNPSKKGVWVSEPYIDPAGRGWMISAIAPVYHEDELVGVPGLDVTLDALFEKHLADLGEPLAVISASGALVMATEQAMALLGLPPLDQHKYIEEIRRDTFRSDEYNLLHSRKRDVRKAAAHLLQHGKTTDTGDSLNRLQLDDAFYQMEAARSHETGWWILHLRKTN